MRRISSLSLCLLFFSSLVNAELIRGIDIDFVTVGNQGNPGDIRTEANPYNCGSVDYIYCIGKYEITADQWHTINISANIDNSWNWNDNQPVAGISWYSAARFCNYLTTGNTEDGVYKFFQGTLTEIMDHQAAGLTYNVAYFLPTEDEWYKAAYYTGSGYSLYANGLDSIPDADNGWNYYGGAYSSPWDVGTGIEEQNGTFDMMGNVWEWNEKIVDNMSGYRGGAYDNSGFGLESSNRGIYYSSTESLNWGFRVASTPEPGTLLLFTLGGIYLRRRRLISQ